MHADELCQHLDDAARPDPAGDVDREAFARPLVDDRQALQRLSVGARVEDEVVRPHVIDAGRRHAPTRSAPRHLQPGLTPQAVRPVGAHHMALPLQEDPNPPIPVARILRGQPPHRLKRRRVADHQLRPIGERRARDHE